MTKDLDDLKAKNSALEHRLAKLEKAAEPSKPFIPMPMPRFDPTSGASMPRSAMEAMLGAVPDRLMSELRGDARRPNPISASTSLSTQLQSQAQPQRRGTGWADPVPLSSPPGVAILDGIMDVEAAKDKAELALKLAQAGLLKPKSEK
jgi:hypothetical protein